MSRDVEYFFVGRERPVHIMVRGTLSTSVEGYCLLFEFYVS